VFSSPEPLRAERGPDSRSPGEGGLGRRSLGEGGFTLIEVLICTLVLTTGMIGIAGMLAVTTQMQIGAREGARSTRLAQDKIDELSELDFETAPAILVGGNLNANAANYFQTLPSPLAGITLRWRVWAGPTDETRILTVRVINLRAQQHRVKELTTIIRE
jgi:hypothetical protein